MSDAPAVESGNLQWPRRGGGQKVVDRTTLHTGKIQRAHAVLPVLEEPHVSNDDDQVIKEPMADIVLTDTLDGDDDAIQDGDRGDERPNDQRVGSGSGLAMKAAGYRGPRGGASRVETASLSLLIARHCGDGGTQDAVVVRGVGRASDATPARAWLRRFRRRVPVRRSRARPGGRR